MDSGSNPDKNTKGQTHVIYLIGERFLESRYNIPMSPCLFLNYKTKTMNKVFLLSILITLISCKKVSDDNFIDDSSDTIQIEIQDESTKPTEVRLWSSIETKLPEGTLYGKDCAGCQSNEKDDTRDNYVVIKRPNNYLTVVRDIDEDLYLNLQIGDIIQ